MSQEQTEPSTEVAGRLEPFVMWLREWNRKRKAERLYRRLWKANDIILGERHGSLHSKDNAEFHAELENCSDQLEKSINVVRKRFAT